MIQQISTSIWEANDHLAMPGGFCFPIRMTVIRLAGERLMLHSPIPISDALAERLTRLGQVTYIVAPNKLHHLYLMAAVRRYPDAQVFAAPGIEKKQPSLSNHETLTEEAPEEWRHELDQIFIEGLPWAHETVFYHRKDRALVVTDLVFNMHEARNLRTRLLLRMVGAWKRTAQSRLLRLGVKDRAAAAASGRKLLGLDVSILIMAHGRVIEHNATNQLKLALHWMTGTH